MIEEHSRIVLTADLPEEGLVAGDAGVVVHIYEAGAAYEVEFFALNGETITVATVIAAQLRAPRRADMVHAREAAPLSV